MAVKKASRTEFDSESMRNLLYGQGPISRFTQDSPVLPDVWLQYAQKPCEQQDLLLTPYQQPGQPPLATGNVIGELSARLKGGKVSGKKFSRDSKSARRHGLAYNQTTIAVRLYFDELVRVVLPMSAWWRSRILGEGRGELAEHLATPQAREDLLKKILNGATGQRGFGPDVAWMIRVIGTIALLNQAGREKIAGKHAEILALAKPPKDLQNDVSADGRAKRQAYFATMLSAVEGITAGMTPAEDGAPLVHLVSLNRPVTVSFWNSTQTIKADAARRLFEISCKDLAWAIIDSGIDARHPAFRRNGTTSDKKKKVAASPGDFSDTTRVVKTYDFTAIRDLLSTDPDDVKRVPPHIQKVLAANRSQLNQLRKRLKLGMEIDWGALAPLIEICHDGAYVPPVVEHGTHVAGILAADWEQTDAGGEFPLDKGHVKGVCPDINLYDLRVIDERGANNEFAVMAAMQFLRYLNSHKEFQVVHGANLSLSIRHEVISFACGQTPICEECERLVDSRLVVVAAAGNRGYITATAMLEEAYRSISITDPGNADEVITVGSTHRDEPHTYGVSYFSSRGPTGDGRMKPALVAPGEKIESCVPGGSFKRMDGTSMAAPHVSGAAALLMARHPELIGRPRRIKEILCSTATDLGRERYFQGAGMLDVLRALQSI